MSWEQHTDFPRDAVVCAGDSEQSLVAGLRDSKVATLKTGYCTDVP